MPAWARRWRIARFVYGITLFATAASFALYFGPNLILFRKLTWISPADFAEQAQQRVAPIVAAVKRYQADHGELPKSDRRLLEQLEPIYLPTQPNWIVLIEPDGTLEYWGKFNHFIVYDFNPSREGWSVRGPFTSGPIPLAPVVLGPTTTSTRPIDSPTTNPSGT